ncbi:Radical SAM domain protein [Gracilaria domingensis]|nr:Radical SAM domain protein [Gracilaria domingensis]
MGAIDAHGICRGRVIAWLAGKVTAGEDALGALAARRHSAEHLRGGLGVRQELAPTGFTGQRARTAQRIGTRVIGGGGAGRRGGHAGATGRERVCSSERQRSRRDEGRARHDGDGEQQRSVGTDSGEQSRGGEARRYLLRYASRAKAGDVAHLERNGARGRARMQLACSAAQQRTVNARRNVACCGWQNTRCRRALPLARADSAQHGARAHATCAPRGARVRRGTARDSCRPELGLCRRAAATRRAAMARNDADVGHNCRWRASGGRGGAAVGACVWRRAVAEARLVPSERASSGLGALCLLLFVHALVPVPGGRVALQVVARPLRDGGAVRRPVAARQIVQPVLSPLPQRPSPTPAPSPQPPAPPSPPPVAPVQQPVPITDGGVVPSQPDFEVTAIPPLSECGGPLFRMQIVLLLELCFEILFLFLRCFAERDDDDDDTSTSGTTDTNASIQINMRAYILIRAIYTVPVLIINVSIYWIGGGPTGACLSNYSELQVPFTHLLFYLFFCVIIIVMGLIRIDEWDPSTTDTSYRSRTFRSNAPPTRTTSYFRYTRPARRSRTSTSYSEPKFRCNLGCCALNL